MPKFRRLPVTSMYADVINKCLERIQRPDIDPADLEEFLRDLTGGCLDHLTQADFFRLAPKAAACYDECLSAGLATNP